MAVGILPLEDFDPASERPRRWGRFLALALNLQLSARCLAWLYDVAATNQTPLVELENSTSLLQKQTIK
ncbi:hypothetical protein ACVWZL_009195 [Bradyrhizobium sp. GM2.4]